MMVLVLCSWFETVIVAYKSKSPAEGSVLFPIELKNEILLFLFNAGPFASIPDRVQDKISGLKALMAKNHLHFTITEHDFVNIEFVMEFRKLNLFRRPLLGVFFLGFERQLELWSISLNI